MYNYYVCKSIFRYLLYIFRLAPSSKFKSSTPGARLLPISATTAEGGRSVALSRPM